MQLEEIIQLKQKKTRVKSQFARVKNQLFRMLESDAYADNEINVVGEKLSTAEVNKMLIELRDIYLYIYTSTNYKTNNKTIRKIIHKTVDGTRHITKVRCNHLQ